MALITSDHRGGAHRRDDPRKRLHRALAGPCVQKTTAHRSHRRYKGPRAQGEIPGEIRALPRTAAIPMPLGPFRTAAIPLHAEPFQESIGSHPSPGGCVQGTHRVLETAELFDSWYHEQDGPVHAPLQLLLLLQLLLPATAAVVILHRDCSCRPCMWPSAFAPSLDAAAACPAA